MNTTDEKPQQINDLGRPPSTVRDSSGRIIARTGPESDTPLTRPSSGFDLPAPLLDLIEATRRQLIAVRVKHGANTAIGHRCSNIVEMLETRAPPAMIAKQMASLEQLLKVA